MMSAPTSLQQRQHSGTSLYGIKQFKSSNIEMASNGSNKSSSSLAQSGMSSGAIRSPSKSNNLINANNSNATSSHELLIESKFNELAKKILDELTQVHYSRDFFQAIDDILKEPKCKSLNHSSTLLQQQQQQQQSIGQHLKIFNRQAAAAEAAAAAATAAAATAAACVNQQQQLQQAVEKLDRQQQSFVASLPLATVDTQPRSLPVEISTNQQQQVSMKQQKGQTKSALPTNSAQNGFFSGNSRPSQDQSQSRQRQKGSLAASQQQQSYPISRSISASDNDNQVGQQQIVKRQQQQTAVARKCPTASNTDDEIVRQPSSQFRRQNYVMGGHLTSCSVDDDDLGDDDDDDDDEDDDDDSEDISLGPRLGGGRAATISQRSSYLNNGGNSNQRFLNPIEKSKTLSDTSNFSDMNSQLTNKRQHHDISKDNKQSHQQQPQAQQTRQRFNPIVRSNTISSSATTGNQAGVAYRQQYQQGMLNGKDIGHLYKPHMNYSTSVLGNHRLSDDDEIIIIPTQSPSLMSTSPDFHDGAGTMNGDDLNERFSISRTKSFWERLSKGSPGKRNSSGDGMSRGGSSSAEGSQPSQHHQVSTIKSAALQAQQHQQQMNNVGSKVVNGGGARSQKFHRMDSMGGSNSNSYSCSSSGDEVHSAATAAAVAASATGAGINVAPGGSGSSGLRSHQHNPTISQIQEMSKQNILRQTR